MTTALVIGDPHAHRRYDNDRFEALGRLAMVRGVDRVHCVGDWTDFPGLSVHKSRKERNTSNYAADLLAAEDALSRFDQGLDEHPVRKTITLGNHDMYPDRYVAEIDPILEGTIAWDDVPFSEYGWRTTPFEADMRLGPFLCSHHFPTSPFSSKPQGGTHATHHNLVKQGTSILYGHRHVFDLKTMTYGDRAKHFGISAGCMVHPKIDEGWCRRQKHSWDVGALILSWNRSGRITGIEWVPYEDFKKGKI